MLDKSANVVNISGDFCPQTHSVGHFAGRRPAKQELRVVRRRNTSSGAGGSVRMRRFKTRLPAAFLVLVILNSFAYADPVSIAPQSASVTVGEAFMVSVSIANVTDLFAFQFDLAFDPSVLAFSSVAEGSFFSSGGFVFFPGFVDSDTGTVSFIANSLVGPVLGVDGSGSLVTLSFTALNAGTSHLSLSAVTLLDSSLNTIDAEIDDGLVTVVNAATVPEANTLVLSAIGLFLAIAARSCTRKETLPPG
jgi:general secretion pathway protein D